MKSVAARSALILRRSHQRKVNAEITGEYQQAWESARWDAPGQELRVASLPETPWHHIVACLSIWQDAPALDMTLPTWAPHVDAIVVADGPYAGSGRGPSTDDLDRVLGSTATPVHRVPWDGTDWADQPSKRTALLRHAAHLFPGALLLVVDADEMLDGSLRAAPYGDVLWVTVQSALYERPYRQPRGIRARPDLTYRGRHHWLHAGKTLLATHQYGGADVEHRLWHVTLTNHRGLGHTPERRQLKRSIQRSQWEKELAEIGHAPQSDSSTDGRESLRILQTTTYDAGLVGYRFHTALNTTTPNTSAFAAMGEKAAFGAPSQYDLTRDTFQLERLASEADVLHCHLDYTGLALLRPLGHPRVVIHHHGTMFRTNAEVYGAMDRDMAKLRLVSNLELLQYEDIGGPLHWLPNPVPVARYRRLREAAWSPHASFRVAHSPSKRALKGTDAFLSACQTLTTMGLNIEPVLIEGRTHAEALRMKATCDAAFDSFWLGIQCSGIEAAAMGMPVIAGDTDCKREYLSRMGQLPYTWANDEVGLVEALEQLATDPAYAANEASRVHRYAVEYHDDANVAIRYLDLLDHAVQWRQMLSLSTRRAA